jgi:Ca-activated chloride channel family protein
VTFARPEFLWLLPLAVAQVPMALRFPAGRRWSSAGLRAACAAAAILALCRPAVTWRSGTDGQARTVVLVDVGPSMPDDAIAAAAGRAAAGQRVLAFATRTAALDDPAALSDPARLTPLRSRLDRPVWPDDPPAGGSALADALDRAGAELDLCGGGTIELVSAGSALRGDAEAEAARLARKGIGIRAVPAAVAGLAPGDAIVRAVTVPASAHVGQTVPAVVTVESMAPRRARVWLRATDGTAAAEATADLTAGVNRVEVDAPVSRAGLVAFRAGVTPAGRQPADDDTVWSATLVQGPPRVLVVGPAAAATALRSVLDRAADVASIAPAELAETSLDGTAVLVLADVPAAAVPGPAWTAVERATADGMGLFVVGTQGLATADGYEGTPLARLLPVRTPHVADRLSPRTAVVLIVDTSGSMEGEKLDLAKAVARLALSHLEPHDEAGLIEFFGGQRWAAPLQPVADGSTLDRALDRLSAGGGTTLYPAVEETAFALRNVDAPVKHVLVVSDGFVEDAPFAELARDMAEDGVAVSTVGVKTDPQERNLMPDLAVWGRGRYYTVPDRFAVPDVTLKRPTVTPQPAVEPTTSRVSAGTDPRVRGVPADGWGNVRAVARATPKATADMLLRTSRGDPVLARWRFGAGWAAVLAAPLGSVSPGDLQGTPAFANTLASLFRQLAGTRGGELRLAAVVRPAAVEIDARATSPGPDARPLRIALSDDHGRPVRTLDVEPTSPGHWNALAVGLRSGAYRMTAAAGRSDAGTCGFAIPPPRAVPALWADVDLLARLEGFRAVAADNLDHRSAVRSVELSRPLALSAMALLVAHVAWRRRRRPHIFREHP